MDAHDEGVVIRYVRLLVHDHPSRGREYLDGLRLRGWSDEELARRVLVPARRKLLGIRASHKLNAGDTSTALSTIRVTLANMPVSMAAERRPRRVLRRPVTAAEHHFLQ